MNPIRKRIFELLLISIIILLASCNTRNSSKARNFETETQLNRDSNALVIIWSSADKEVALKAALAFALNSKLNGWMQDVTVLAWGPSVQLLAKDKEIQNVFTYLRQAGVIVLVDKKCVEEYQANKEMEILKLEVKSLGKTLTTFIQQKRTILTF
jgi:hypothetical protein